MEVTLFRRELLVGLGVELAGAGVRVEEVTRYMSLSLPTPIWLPRCMIELDFVCEWRAR